MQLFGEQAHHNADKSGGDDPTPPWDAAPGQVDQSMADEADQAAGNRAVHSGQQGQHCILQADVGVRHRAGDCHKTPQHKEQCCADTNGDNGLDAIVVFHNSALLYNITNDPLGTCRKTAWPKDMVSIRPVKTACQWAKTALCAIWTLPAAVWAHNRQQKAPFCRGKAGYHFANTSLRRQFGKCELVGVKLRHFACAKTFCRSNIPLGCLLLAQTRTCRSETPPFCLRKNVLSLKHPAGVFVASANANLWG